MVNNNNTIKSKLTAKQILTIPNILSFVRLLLIPLIIWLYCVELNYVLTLIIIIASGLTDVVDGFIARRFNMVTDFGKFIDPVADKLTQIAILFCLVSRFNLMWLPLIILISKEIFALILRYIVFRKTGEIKSAEWHGKLSTVLLYLLMGLHVVWFNINNVVSIVLIILTSIIMTISGILYGLNNILKIKKERTEN